jgi:DNA-binding LacI/PurR family transcriptional regulator
MVTKRDVAQQAGISITTVSHVLNNTRPVSEDLRLRVKQAMSQLGDVPKRAAHVVSPALTTLDQFHAQIGQRATALLLGDLLARQPLSGRCVELPYQLQIRAST